MSSRLKLISHLLNTFYILQKMYFPIYKFEICILDSNNILCCNIIFCKINELSHVEKFILYSKYDNVRV